MATAGQPGRRRPVAAPHPVAGRRPTPGSSTARPTPDGLDGLDLVFLRPAPRRVPAPGPRRCRPGGGGGRPGRRLPPARPRALPDLVRRGARRAPSCWPVRSTGCPSCSGPGWPGPAWWPPPAATRRPPPWPWPPSSRAGAVEPTGHRGRRGQRGVGGRAGGPPSACTSARSTRASPPTACSTTATPPRSSRPSGPRCCSPPTWPRWSGASWPPVTPGRLGAGSTTGRRPGHPAARPTPASRSWWSPTTRRRPRPPPARTAPTSRARVDDRTGWLLALCALDNLVKGAAGPGGAVRQPGARPARGGPACPMVRAVPVSVTAPGGSWPPGAAAGSRRAAPPTWPWWPPTTGGAVPAAGVFTANLAAGGARSRLSRAHLAATGGPGGRRSCSPRATPTPPPARPACGRASGSCALVADGRRGRRPSEVLVCQTGLIGIPFPIDVVARRCRRWWPPGRPGAAAAEAAATAIMTTDTVRKEVVVARRAASPSGAWPRGRPCWRPNMATMLAVLTTDAAVDRRPRLLGPCCAAAVGPSFNAHDRRRLHLDQRHGAGAGQRPGRQVDRGALAEAPGRGLRVAGRADGGRRRGGHQGRPHRRHRGPQRRRGPPGGPQGGRLAAGQVLAQRRGPVLGPGGERAGLGRGGLRARPGARSPTAGWWSAAAGWRSPHDAAAVAAHLAGRHVEIELRPRPGRGLGGGAATDLGHGYIDENRTTS